MGRYDLAPEDKQSIVGAARCGDIGRAVEIANRLIWDSLTKNPDGTRIEWMPLASEKRVREILGCRPKILRSVPEDTLTLLNFAAAMAVLLGPQYYESEWLPKGLNLGLPMTTPAAVRMFYFCARHYEQVRVYAQMGVERLKIHVCHNTDGSSPACAICEQLKGSIWTAATIPELPYEKCVNALGCRCLAMADV